MTPVRVRGLHGVARDAEAVLVVETLAGGGALAFRIPPGEAARVARVLGLAGCRRVPVYDLIGALAAGLGGRLSAAVLETRPGGVAGRIRIVPPEGDQRVLEIPCRPADAIALALRVGAPIYATGAPLAPSAPDTPGGDASRVAAWLERVRPEDFVAPTFGRGDSEDA
jgi:bifunctional DNase/RNase